eukprot:Skav209965  [mRNA]  locus=scaffold4929:13164:14973:+ [translate_table: standard]
MNIATLDPEISYSRCLPKLTAMCPFQGQSARTRQKHGSQIRRPGDPGWEIYIFRCHVHVLFQGLFIPHGQFLGVVVIEEVVRAAVFLVRSHSQMLQDLPDSFSVRDHDHAFFSMSTSELLH